MATTNAPVRKRPTIRDVAATAGVSKSLVSRAFVDPARVGAENLQRIKDAADALGFRPSWSARTLNASDGGFVGIVVADLYSPAFAPIIVGASRRLEREGRSVLTSSASFSEPGADRALEDAPIAFMGDLRPASLLVIGSVHDMSSLATLASSLPTVVAGARDVDLPVAAEVFTDDEAGMDDVVSHLARLGHRDIAHIAGVGRVGRSRAEAYQRAMNTHGLAEHISVEWADFEEPAGYEAAHKLLTSPRSPTAIAAASDPTAVGALAAVKEIGSRTSVVGYGDTAVAGYRLTQLTTVNPDSQRIGAEAAEALLTAEDRVCPVKRRVRVAPHLVQRATTEPVVH